MNVYTGLLFLEGHLAEPKLLRDLAGQAVPAASRAEATPLPRSDSPPATCRRGAVASVCGALSLSPFR